MKIVVSDNRTIGFDDNTSGYDSYIYFGSIIVRVQILQRTQNRHGFTDSIGKVIMLHPDTSLGFNKIFYPAFYQLWLNIQSSHRSERIHQNFRIAILKLLVISI